MLPESTLTLCSLYTSEIASYATGVAEAKERYARNHGYDWFCPLTTLDPTRPPSWSKIICCLRAFGQGADWVFWSDADALITNPLFEAKSLIDDNSDFICCEGLSANFTNMGCFFIRRCEASYQFLSDVWHCDPYYWDCAIWEQAVCNQILRTGKHQMRVKVLPRKTFNQYLEDWQPDDFILHFAGMKNRKAIIPKFLDLQ